MSTVRLLLALFLGTVAASQAAPADAGESLTGTWKLNLKESIAPQGVMPSEYTIVVRRADAVFNYTYSAQEDGKPVEVHFAAAADGKAHEYAGTMKVAILRLPSGNYEARVWWPDGTYEDKFCELLAGGDKQICLATVTAPGLGQVVFSKDVLDRQ